MQLGGAARVENAFSEALHVDDEAPSIRFNVPTTIGKANKEKTFSLSNSTLNGETTDGVKLTATLQLELTSTEINLWSVLVYNNRDKK